MPNVRKMLCAPSILWNNYVRLPFNGKSIRCKRIWQNLWYSHFMLVQAHKAFFLSVTVIRPQQCTSSTLNHFVSFMTSAVALKHIHEQFLYFNNSCACVCVCVMWETVLVCIMYVYHVHDSSNMRSCIPVSYKASRNNSIYKST